MSRVVPPSSQPSFTTFFIVGGVIHHHMEKARKLFFVGNHSGITFSGVSSVIPAGGSH